MPLYDFLNSETGETEEHTMPWSAMEQFLKDHPLLSKVVTAPRLVDPLRLGNKRGDGQWKEVLQKVQNAHPKGVVNF